VFCQQVMLGSPSPRQMDAFDRVAKQLKPKTIRSQPSARSARD
jgi:hypothetical protein